MALTSDSLVMQTIRLFKGLVGKSSLEITSGWETRADNIQTSKQFFYIEIYNPGPFSFWVNDVSLRWDNPARARTVKSIIVGEEKKYPVLVRAGIRWRIHFLPSLMHLTEFSGISVELGNGQRIQTFVDSAALAAGQEVQSQVKFAGGLRLR
jgi:hypothetical protein